MLDCQGEDERNFLLTFCSKKSIIESNIGRILNYNFGLNGNYFLGGNIVHYFKLTLSVLFLEYKSYIKLVFVP